MWVTESKYADRQTDMQQKKIMFRNDFYSRFNFFRSKAHRKLVMVQKS